ncbi:type II restriction endonuclease [Nocardioides taihuensis]|uniref:Type II restriction endonuclease n=1 Tax=Nocardioides taihuensis TaxID=1835606 RepID=A0ABW0BKN7_9ACTN
MDARLRDHFDGVGAKKLSATEAASAQVSRGHELAAGGPVLDLLGRSRTQFSCHYLYFNADEVLEDRSTITLYDAREHQQNRSPEWRLYYPSGCQPMEAMQAGDWCWVGRLTTGSVMVVVAAPDTSAAVRLNQLFGTQLDRPAGVTPVRSLQFDLFDLEAADDGNLDLDDADLLQTLGISPTVEHEDLLPRLVDQFGGRLPMPPVAQFAALCRDLTLTSDPTVDPDQALFDWVTTTNDLYFAYERQVVQPLLDAEFAHRDVIDIDIFFAVATRLKNARFSRAGKSFESHIAAMLDATGLRYETQVRLEDGSKPDFLFPGLRAPADLQTQLAAKTTTKERWRQVVGEGRQSQTRYLVTMDRGLNLDVVTAMEAKDVAVVVPSPVRATYGGALAPRLTTVRDFITIASERQARAVASGVLP